MTAEASRPHLLCDARLAHRQFLKAGLGPEVANSFVVVAGRAKKDADALLGQELVWTFGDARRRQWRRHRAIVASSDGLHVLDRGEVTEARSLGWLTQASGPRLDRPLAPGEPLDIPIIEAVQRDDLAAASKLLVRWRSELDSHAQPAPPGNGGHPFAAVEGSPALPEDFLDVLPSNFILHEGSLTFIDREWLAPGPVCAETVEVRALWYLARQFVRRRRGPPLGILGHDRRDLPGAVRPGGRAVHGRHARPVAQGRG